MVSNRCKMIVQSGIEKLGLHSLGVKLGVIEIEENLSEFQLHLLNADIQESGLELLADKKGILVEKVKITVIELVHYMEAQLKTNFSDYLAEKLQHDYTYLSNIFSESQGISIEHFFIMHRIEKVKELLVYNELNISEIAYKTHFSSSAHLSNQFRKVTGMSPSEYRHLKLKARMPLENM